MTKEPKYGEVMQRIISHYEADETQSMEIAEWGDGETPLTVTWSKLTIADSDHLAKEGKDRTPFYRMVDAIVLKARDADGKKLFDVTDRRRLMEKADRNVLMRLGAAILSGESVSAEDAEKN